MYREFPVLLPLIGAFLLGMVLIPICIRVAFLLGIIDDPAHRKIHSVRTAYLGGVGLFGALFLTVGIAWKFWPDLQGYELKQILLISCATLMAVSLGLVDDKFHIRPRYKLLGQILIATLFTLFGYRFQLLTLPNILVDLQWLSVPLTIFWIVAMINAYNMIDGMDGLAGTTALLASAMLVVFAAYFHAAGLGLMGLASFGATAAFLIFNWAPAKIFLGDAGSLGLGTFFATAFLATGNKEPFGLPMVTETIETTAVPFKIISVTFLLIYPALEVFLTVTRRLLRGKPVSTADRGHLHHRLLARGWRPSWICMGVVILSLLAQGAVLAALVHNLGLAAWMLGILGVLLGLSLHYMGLLDLLNPLVVRYFRPHYLIANHLISMLRLKLTLTRSGSQVLSLMSIACRELGVIKYSLTYFNDSTQSNVQRDWFNPDEPGLCGEDRNGIEVAAPTVGFTDRFQDPATGAAAVWSFKSVVREEELDIEYRVLMSSFMEAAVRRLVVLPQQTEEDARRKSAVLDFTVGASHLREMPDHSESLGAPVGPAALARRTADASGTQDSL